MDLFRKFMTYLGVYNKEVDFISDLPTEISHIILSKLDNQSLLNAALVSHKWLSVVKSTKSSRQRVRRHLRRRHRKLSQVLPPVPANRPVNPTIIPFISVPHSAMDFKPIHTTKRPINSKLTIMNRLSKNVKISLRI